MSISSATAEVARLVDVCGVRGEKAQCLEMPVDGTAEPTEPGQIRLGPDTGPAPFER